MLIIGCDYHPGMQQIAWFDEASGECGEQRLEHSTGEGESYYRELKRRGVQVRMGIEASGHTRWFERLLAELEIELWIGNPARSRRNGWGNKSRTAKMRGFYCGCCGKIVFRDCGCRAGRIVTCGNCCGTGIGWCRCGRGSRINCTLWP